MKVNRGLDNSTTFDKVCKGGLFEYDCTLYIKGYTEDEDDNYNAVNVVTGEIIQFYSLAKVTPYPDATINL